ncbi:gamma-glutamyltransferase family protein [Desulfurobacterium atlanticum]|uniref:Gamma-glutamyltranspeptidase / glutathione hydrolase n=1 Tax=Desulfurobacterium atlanticum TaxID=240169 RepID=A0A238YJ53_9BACT|nr:gamma-glutamyltransferase [Desulfurobacterium atlanticum]SNR70643.1 gamma-glutamyltranspeptidase / glutathione hydrolase [Desulfurobacterium atlanticum]
MKGIVAAGDRLTAEAAEKVLKEGGNAFDAVVAAVFASYMCEPALTSPAGGGFLLAFEQGYSPVLYDFFVDVPPLRVESPDFFKITVDFGDALQDFHIGCASIAVPGTVAGLLRVHEERGKLPLADVLYPAMEYAKKGVVLSSVQASFVKLLEPIFTATDESRKVFMANGKLIDETSVFKNHSYYEFLSLLSRKGQWVFYEGEIADRIDNLCRNCGGHLRKEDLEKYKVEEREPLKFSFKGYDILTNNLPFPGGILIAFTLKLLEDFSLGEFGSKQHLVKLLNAMKETNRFRREFVDDGKVSNYQDYLNSAFMESYKREVNRFGNTTHISVIDGYGNAASITTTNGEGSGYIIPDTGVMLNNMLGEEDLNPKGFFKWPPYVRLPSMMSPTVVVKDGEPILVLGSAGSNRIRSAIVNVILNYLAFDMNVKDAVDAPRVHYENGTVFVEPGFEEDVLKGIENLFSEVVRFSSKNMFFGGVQAVTGSFCGAGDPRRGGFVLKVD